MNPLEFFIYILASRFQIGVFRTVLLAVPMQFAALTSVNMPITYRAYELFVIDFLLFHLVPFIAILLAVVLLVLTPYNPC